MNKRIIRAVLNQLGYSLSDVKLSYQYGTVSKVVFKNTDLENTLKDISNYGINGGFSGFIYYNETIKFFNKLKKDIVEFANEEAHSIGYGYDNLDLLDDEDMKEVKNYLFRNFDVVTVSMITSFNGFEDVGDVDQLKNLMAWYVAEQVAYKLTDF